MIKKLLVVGTVLATLGTGTGVFAATKTQTPSHSSTQAATYTYKKHIRMEGRLLRLTAKTLGMDEKTLIGKLKTGQSVADVAKARGISTQTLKSELQKAIKARLDQAVKSGKISSEQEQKCLSKTSKGLNRFIAHKGLPKHHWKKRRFEGALLKEAAKTLKLNEKTLIGKLKSGQSLADVAKAQGISTETLKSDLQKAIKARLDKAVESGKMTSAQEQKRLSETSKRLDQFIAHKGLPKRAHWRKHGFRMEGALLKEAAKTLKLNEKTLIGKLKSGQSLADVAKAQGVSTETLKSNLQNAIKTRLEQAVKSGKMTATQEQKILSVSSKKLNKLIQHKGLPKRGHHFRGMILKTAATALKLDKKQLIQELKSGKSLADIAKAQGISTAALKTDMEKDLKTKLDRFGKLSAAKEKKILKKYGKALDHWINQAS